MQRCCAYLLQVSVTLKGDTEGIEKFQRDLLSLDRLNSWGAKAEKIQTAPSIIPLEDHTVTTENVNSFNWDSNVEFYFK